MRVEADLASKGALRPAMRRATSALGSDDLGRRRFQRPRVDSAARELRDRESERDEDHARSYSELAS